jgi:RNA polymerase sigma factor (sigma-70 family)
LKAQRVQTNQEYIDYQLLGYSTTPQSRLRILENVEESLLLEGCLKGNLKSQELFYKHFYGYAMSIALRYSNNREEAAEILNDSFLKVFTNLQKHKSDRSLKAWIRRIVINTALDKYRQNRRRGFEMDIADIQEETLDENVIDKLSAEDIMRMVQQLPPDHRTVFNLYEIEGFNHEEISQMLGMPVGTSKSNLSRAKSKLRQLITSLQTLKT